MPSSETQFGKRENHILASKSLAELEAKFEKQSFEEITRTLEALEDFKFLLDHDIFENVQKILLGIRYKLAERLPNEPAEVTELDDHLPKSTILIRMRKTASNDDTEKRRSKKKHLKLMK